MSDKDVAPFLCALAHELRPPLQTALYAADQGERALDRLLLKLDALNWLGLALEDESRARRTLKPRAVAAALGDVPRFGTDLTHSIPLDLRMLAAKGALQLVLEALLSNASKHARGAPVLITARILEENTKPWPPTAQVRLSGRSVLLTVADAGPGVSARVRPRLFEAIPRAFGMRIGLWLCRLLVRAHGGDLWLDDTTRGASFSSVWPKVPTPSGFKTMPKERQWQIAGIGGKTAQARGTGHRFTIEEAKRGGQKGGRTVSSRPGHMAQIGRLGGRGGRLVLEETTKAAQSPPTGHKRTR